MNTTENPVLNAMIASADCAETTITASHAHAPAPGGTVRHCYVGSGDRTRWTATLRETCACGSRRLVHVAESVDRDGSPVAERDEQAWVR